MGCRRGAGRRGLAGRKARAGRRPAAIGLGCWIPFGGRAEPSVRTMGLAAVVRHGSPSRIGRLAGASLGEGAAPLDSSPRSATARGTRSPELLPQTVSEAPAAFNARWLRPGLRCRVRSLGRDELDADTRAVIARPSGGRFAHPLPLCQLRYHAAECRRAGGLCELRSDCRALRTPRRLCGNVLWEPGRAASNFSRAAFVRPGAPAAAAPGLF